MIGLLSIAGSGLLLLLLTIWKRHSPFNARSIPALARMYHALGLSVEDGTRLHIALGDGEVLTAQSGPGLAGLAMLRQLAERTSASDRPPVAAAGDATLALLAQDTLRAGYLAADAQDTFQPTTGRLAGMSPFGYAAGSLPMIRDEDISAALLIGHFGAEAALLADSAERQNAVLLGASDDLSGQAVLFAASQDALIGEELFAAAAYLGGGPANAASLTLQDILRWLIILSLCAGAAAKFAGLL